MIVRHIKSAVNKQKKNFVDLMSSSLYHTTAFIMRRIPDSRSLIRNIGTSGEVPAKLAQNYAAADNILRVTATSSNSTLLSRRRDGRRSVGDKHYLSNPDRLDKAIVFRHSCHLPSVAAMLYNSAMRDIEHTGRPVIATSRQLSCGGIVCRLNA